MDSQGSSKNIENFKKKNKQHFAYFSFLLFFISPMLSLPLILHDIFYRKRGALLLLAMFMGILTYLLLPDWSLDLARYYQYYDIISEYSLSELNEFLGLRPDYIYYILIYIFSYFNIKFQILLFVMTTFNYYVAFRFFEKISLSFNVSKKAYFNFFILFFLSISLLYYLSATRFVLATSFFILFLDAYFFGRSKAKSYLLFIIVTLIHISFMIFIPILIGIGYVRNRKVIFKIALILALIVLLVPMSLILNILVVVVPSLALKISLYLAEERAANIFPVLSYYVTIIIALVFLIKTYRFLPLKLYKLYLILFVAVLITLPFGYLVYDRYMVLFKPILVCVFFGGYLNTNSLQLKKTINRLSLFLYFPFILYFIYSCYLYRENIAPYFYLENLFLYNILSQTYSLKDIFIL